MSKRVYVGNLSFNTGAFTLRPLCSEGGRTVADLRIATDDDTGQHKGFALVDFTSDDDATSAIVAMNGAELDGNVLSVHEVRRQGESAIPLSPRLRGSRR